MLAEWKDQRETEPSVTESRVEHGYLVGLLLWQPVPFVAGPIGESWFRPRGRHKPDSC